MPNGQNQGQQSGGDRPAPPPPTSGEIERKLPDPNEAGDKNEDKFPLAVAPTPEPYIFPHGLSAPDQWARDSYRVETIRNYPGVAPGPWAPQIDEARELVRRNAAYFIQNGSRQQALSAARMVAYNDKYWKDYLQFKHLLAQESHDKYTQEEEQFTRNNRDMFALYADAFAIYEGQDEGKLRQRLRELTYRFEDKNLRDVLDNQGIARVKAVISDRVNHNEAQLHLALQRAQAEQAERAKTRQDTLDKLLTPPEEEQPPAPGSRQQPLPPQPTVSDVRLPRVNPQIRKWSQQYQMDPAKMPAAVAALKSPELEVAVDRDHASLNEFLNAIINEPTVGRGPTVAERQAEIMPLVRSANPAMANKIENFLAGRDTPTATQSDKEPDNTALRIAGKINPDLRRDWALRASQLDLVNKRTQLQLARPELASLLAGVENIRTAVKRNVRDFDRLITMANEAGGTLRPVIDRRLRWLNKEYAGDPQVTALDTQITEVGRDAAQILATFNGTNRGGYTVYAQRRMAELIDKGSTAAQIKAQADLLKYDYENQLNSMASEYNRLSDQFFPGGNNPHLEIDDMLEVLRAGRPPLPTLPPFREVR